MPIPAKGNVDVMMRLQPKLVARVDAIAKRCQMNRSEFMALLVEIALDNEEPFIDFALKMGELKAKLVWPRWKPERKTARA